MVAADDDWSLDLPAVHQVVHSNAEFGAFAIPKPANPRRQSLIMNPLSRELHPSRERFVFRKQFEGKLVGTRDVCRFAAQRDPTKRPASFAKKRPNVLRDKTGNVERVFHAGFLRLRTNVVAVIKRNR